MNDSDFQGQWQETTDKFKTWLYKTFFVRKDAYARYNAEGVPACIKEPINATVITRHCTGAQTIGAYTTDPDDDCGLWLGGDIDYHGDDAPPDCNFKYAVAKHDELKRMGFDPILEDSNGRGGFHLWILFSERVLARRLFSFGHWLFRDSGDHSIRPEVFPKQPSIKKEGVSSTYGNQMRLPGRHPKRPHYSRIWDGSKWLNGKDAIEYMMARNKSTSNAIPQEALAYVRPAAPRRAVDAAKWKNYHTDQWWTNYDGDLKTLDIVQLFDAEGMLRNFVGGEQEVLCPWHDLHTTGDGGTAVWEAAEGSFPGFNCLHSHCEGRTLEDVLAWFGKDKVDALCKPFGDPTRLKPQELDAVDRIVRPVDLTTALASVPVKLADPNPLQTEYGLILTWDDIVARAGKDKTFWVIDHVIGVREISMPHSLPWGGKSTILSKAVACVCQGQDFFGFKVNPVPVLYINADQNSYDLFLDRIQCHVDDQDAMRKYLFAPEFENIPAPLPADYLANMVHGVRAKTGAKYVWCIIDTLRPAFMVGKEAGSENDSTVMTNILTPLKAFAVKQAVAITPVHHNSRGTDNYSGSAATAGKVDSFIGISRDMDSNTAEVKIHTRRGLRETLRVQRDSFGKLYLASIDDATVTTKKDHDLDQFINQFPDDVSKAIDLDAVLSLPWVAAKGWVEGTVRNKLASSQRAGVHPRLENLAPNGAKGRYIRV